MPQRVLVIAAHPDDETYGMGGTIARHVLRGDHVAVMIMTDGVTARHTVTAPQEAAALNACAALGVEDVRFARLPDQRLDAMPLLEVIRPIAAAINDIGAQIVYTHHRGDANQDHRTLFAATMVAIRPFGACPVLQAYSYEVASSTEWGAPFSETAFVPNHFVAISATLEAKLRAVAAYTATYESEVKPFPHPRSPEATRIYAQQRGVSVGMPAAEAFVTIRTLVKESDDERNGA
jgi:LmbE family N-acetylglucosaminyl deacetylase